MVQLSSMEDSLEKPIDEQRNTMTRSEFLEFVKKVGIVGLVSMLFSGKLPRNPEKLLPEYSPNPLKDAVAPEQNTVSPDQIALESIIEHFQPQIAEITPELHGYAKKALDSLRNGKIPIEPALHLSTPELVVAYAILKLIIHNTNLKVVFISRSIEEFTTVKLSNLRDTLNLLEEILVLHVTELSFTFSYGIRS